MQTINWQLTIASFALPLFFITFVVNADCLDTKNLKALDAKYESALKNDDTVFFEQYLHPNFVWVHNHASSMQNSRDELLSPMRKRKENNKPSHSTNRTQENVTVLVANSTAVVHGYTVVERKTSPVDENGNKIGDRYHFMRTYYKEADKCFLLANHTMKIPNESN